MTTGPSRLGPPVVSPFLAAEAAHRAAAARPMDDAGVSVPLDAVTLGGGPADSGNVSEGRSRWSILVACAATACSLLGSAPVAAASGQALAATVSSAPVGQSSLAAIIEHMLTPPGGQPPMPTAMRQQVVAALRQVPPEVLRVLEAQGTRITVVREGESPLEAGLIGSLDLEQAYRDPGALAGRADHALRTVDQAFSQRTAALEARVRVAESREKASGRFSEEAESLRLDMLSLRSDRDEQARRAVQEATDGLVDPATQGTAGFLPGPGGIAETTTLREMARAHGAATPAETAQFVDLVQRLNGDRVGEAQAEYAQANPATSAGLALEDRPFLANATNVLVPAYEYHRPQDAPGAPPLVLRTHDAVSVMAWHDGGVLGQYFYQDHRQSVAISERAFAGSEGPAHTVLHELGHAFEDAARRQGGPAYGQFRQERDQAFARLEGNRRHPFAFTHAGSSPSEMTAETFAVATEHRDASLRKADARWMQAFDRLERDSTRHP